jgi:hypothetical protein
MTDIWNIEIEIMKVIIEFLRILFISFEFVLILVILLTLPLIPDVYALIGNKFIADTEIWKYIPILPLSLAGASINYAWKILTPLSNSSNRALYEWPNYWKLKLRVIVSIVLCVLCLSLAILLWLFCKDLRPAQIGALYIGITIVPLIVVFNQLLAAFSIKELLEP